MLEHLLGSLFCKECILLIIVIRRTGDLSFEYLVFRWRVFTSLTLPRGNRYVQNTFHSFYLLISAFCLFFHFSHFTPRVRVCRSRSSFSFLPSPVCRLPSTCFFTFYFRPTLLNLVESLSLSNFCN